MPKDNPTNIGRNGSNNSPAISKLLCFFFLGIGIHGFFSVGINTLITKNAIIISIKPIIAYIFLSKFVKAPNRKINSPIKAKTFTKESKTITGVCISPVKTTYITAESIIIKTAAITANRRKPYFHMK